MPNRLGYWSQTWAMLWQCSKNIKTGEDYNSPYDSPPPITSPHPLLYLSSPYPSPYPSPIPRTWHSETCCRTLLLLLYYLLPLLSWLLNPWWHPSPHSWTVYPHLLATFHMSPSLEAPWPIRHSMPYSTSPLMTLSPSSLSSSRFTQPFAPFSPGPPGIQQVPLTSSRLPLLRKPPLSSPLSSVFLRHENLSWTFYILRDSITPFSSFLLPSLMLFSPPSFFCSQKANNWLSMQITPFPLAYPKPTGQPPYSPTVPSPSISAEVCSLTETIQSLETLLKERTPTPPLSQSSHLPLPLYHQADPHLPDPLPFPTPYTDKVPSYLLPGWPLPPPPAIFAPHWEQLQSGALRLPPILWNPLWSLLQPYQPQA